MCLMNIQTKAIVLFLAAITFVSPVFAQFQGLDYDIRGAKVLGFETDPENTSLTILLDARSRGELVITLPRDLIDAKFNSEDADFKILVSGLNLNFFDETVTAVDRTITIPFSRSDYEITIIGTQFLSQDNSPKTQLNTIEKMIDDEMELNMPQNQAKLLIFSDTQWSGALQSTTFGFTEISGQNDDEIVFECESSMGREGIFGAKLQKATQDGYLRIVAIQNQTILSQGSTVEPFGDVLINGDCVSEFEIGNGGGCLIATATFGSELAPQVQQLREIRDNKLLNTESGTFFINSFNDFYYSFSPHVSDYERENPAFKEMVKIAITPMISSLSILNHVDLNSERKVLGYGVGLILLNIGMYAGIPACVIIGIKKKF